PIMRRLKTAGIALMVVVAAACATRPVVPPATTGPRYPDFAYPNLPNRVGDERMRARHDRAWQLLQVGDLRAAGKEFAAIVGKAPAFYPGLTGWGFVLVADGKPKDALGRFEQAIRLAPQYAPALAGQGEALLSLGQRDDALTSFEAALAADPTLVDLPRRIDVLRFGRVRDLVAAAKRAADAGRLDEARRAYESALATSPDSGFLYRDLGLVELRMSELPSAIAHLQKAVAIDGADARALLGLADAFEKQGDVQGTVSALERAYAIDPTDALKQRLDKLRDRVELARLPDEYRAIPGLAQVTRGDLAALVGVRLQALVATSRQRSSVVATDVRGHWAATWIVSVTRAGIMEVYPNHTFQPRTVVRRVELAQLVSRVLALAGADSGRPGAARAAIGDVGPDHLQYGDISAAVASGAMSLDGGFFRPSRPVSGQEAQDVVQRLERLTAKRRSGSG
ncbi:MAG: tetratricopeptide repeat protein, partial [Acidobacteria bacterium]|nr:tetratricopeptide repeat protein [Acidobacteriota bacterium]